MTLRESVLGDFERAFAGEVERRIDAHTLGGDLHSDGPLVPGEFNLDTALALRDGGPWGSGFPEPSFDGRFGVVETRVLGERHLKLRLKAASGEFADAIAFRYLDDPAAVTPRPQQEVECVYRPAVNEYAGTRRLQLVSEWLRPLA
jgi:single-stranded-DNA-specific exonuclease